MPTIPAIGDLTAVPVVQALAMGNPSLTNTRTALAKLFTIHLIV